MGIYAAYRAYESSNVSGSAQAWYFCTACSMTVCTLLAISLALGDSRVPAGSASAQAATLASRVAFQRVIFLVLFSQSLRTLMWVRGDDPVREAYSYQGGHPFLGPAAYLLVCKML